jgi:putative tricarboxylic transport membrane protein
MSENSSRAAAGPSQRSVEIGVALFLLGFAGVVLYGALQAGIDWGAEGPRAGFFPFYVALLIIGASLFNLVSIFLVPPSGLFAEWGQLRQVLSVVIPTAVYVFLVPWLGFYVASILLIAVFMRWLGKYRWGPVAGVSFGVPALAYLMFEKWFLVPLPRGPVEDLLGL